MPYAIRKRDGKYCVDNTETGENKGCSENRAMAVKHMAALYVHEKKSIKEIPDLILKATADFTEETGEEFTSDELDLKSYDGEYVEGHYFYPWSATSYAEVDAQRDALRKAGQIQELVQLFPTLTNNILNSSEMTEAEKTSGIKMLSDELIDKISELSASDGNDDEDEVKAISKREDVSEADKKRAVGEYGNVRYADPKNKKYPIDTAAHIRAAWNYINMPRNARKYSSSEASAIKRRIISAWKSKIDKKGPPSSEKMRKDLGLLAEHVAYYLKSIAGLDNDEAESDLLICKDDSGRLRWIARYSNNFEDTDNDIISAKSHRRFVDMVNKGVYPYPVIELWHESAWEFGQADWVAYDDAGFALASGLVNKGCEPIAETVSQLKSVANSHGMPKTTIVRDPEDPRVIVEHQTVEISVLPDVYAANPLTSSFFIKESTEEDIEMIPKDKKAEALKAWGVSETLLADLEALNEKEAKDADSLGMESKDATPADNANADNATPDPVANAAPEPPDVTDKSGDAGVDAADQPPTRTEVAEVIANLVSPLMESIQTLQSKMDELGVEIKAVKVASDTVKQEVEDVRQENILKEMSPIASLMARFSTDRAVGSADAELKEGDPLNKEKPKEAPVQPGPTGIHLIDTLLAPPAR